MAGQGVATLVLARLFPTPTRHYHPRGRQANQVQRRHYVIAQQQPQTSTTKMLSHRPRYYIGFPTPSTILQLHPAYPY